MSTIAKQLWRNILKIRSDNDEEFVRYILEARSSYLGLRLKQEPEIRHIYSMAAANVAEQIRALAPGTSELTRNHLRALEKSLTREADNINRALTARLGSDLAQAVALGGRPLQMHMVGALQAAQAPLSTITVQRAFGDVNTAAVEAFWARTKNGMKLSDRIWNTAQSAREDMRTLIADGIARGRDVVQVARDLEQYVNKGAATMAGDYPGMLARMGKRVPKDVCYEALRLARSEMSMAFMEGTYASGRVNPAYKGVRWNLSGSHPLPDICDDLASADLYGLGPGGYPAGDEPPYPHPNCVVAGTVVTGPPVLASTTRWYEGDIVEIRTARGHNLTVTPNHPILTPDGWVAAGLLKAGGYVVSSGGCHGDGLIAALSIVCPDYYQVPALIEDVAASTGKPGSMPPITVPVAAKDFHGDGKGSEVCVIRPNCLLADHVDSSLGQPRLQLQFLGRCMELLSLSGACPCAEFLEGSGAAPNGGVGGLDVSPVLLGGPFGVHELLCLPECPALNASCMQAGSDDISGYSVPNGERILGDSREVTGHDVVNGQGKPSQESKGQLGGSQCLDFGCGTQESAINNDIFQALIPDVVRTGSSIQAFARAIRLDRVINVSRIQDFEGHVYNLQTSLGWYAANNIVIHNCLCTVSPIAEDTKEFVDRLKRWRDDPSGDPELEQWYNDVYLGKGADSTQGGAAGAGQAGQPPRPPSPPPSPPGSRDNPIKIDNYRPVGGGLSRPHVGEVSGRRYVFKLTGIPPGTGMIRNNLEAELLAEQIFEHLGAPAPRVDFAWFDTGNGIEQLLRIEFVESAMDPRAFVNKYGVDAVNSDFFKQMQVIDVLIGNGDRHQKNFLLLDNNGSGEVIPIDHNTAFGTDKVFAPGVAWQKCFLGAKDKILDSCQTPQHIVSRNLIGHYIGQRDGTNSYLPIIAYIGRRLTDSDIERMVNGITDSLAEPSRKAELIDTLKYRRDHLVDFFRSIIW